MTAPETHRTIDAVWRIESAKLIAGLARIVRDVGLAEDLAQDALVAALEQWPESGVPETRAPGSWPRRSIGRSTTCAGGRCSSASTRSSRASSRPSRRRAATDLDAAIDDDIGDDLLRLVFTACHPVLSAEARVALTLRLLGGLTTEEIARAFLVPEPTIAQRIVRAKRTLAEARVPFEVPRGAELAARLSSVLEVIYLVFNEGYAATAGDDWMRPRSARTRCGSGASSPSSPRRSPRSTAWSRSWRSRRRARGRARARRASPILLLDQDRARWDHLLIRRGLAALERAEALGGAAGPYALQAAIAACHARAPTPAETDWARIAALYEELAQRHAVAGRRAESRGRGRHGVRPGGGPRAGRCPDRGAFAPDYHLLPSVRGDLLAKLGRLDEARAEFERAASITRNARERELLLDRARGCAGGMIAALHRMISAQ